MPLIFRVNFPTKDVRRPGVGARRRGYRHLFESTAPLALALATAGASPALAQVTLNGNNNPSIVGAIDPSTDLRIGDGGIGTMTIAGGSQVTNAAGYIGLSAGDQGGVTVTGLNSLWTNTGQLTVGDDGIGRLSILAGGRVTSVGESYIGVNGNGDGEVLVTGTGSSWENAGRLNLGAFGIGKLRIEAGSTVSNADGLVGDSARGEVVVTGSEAKWENSGQLTIGSYGSGTLLIENGAMVTSNQGYIGAGPPADGDVVVTGTGSRWIAATNINIGNYGIGSLTVEDGARVRADHGIELGISDGLARGTLTLRGTAGARGVLETVRIAGGLGTANVTIDGGILRPISNNSDFIRGFGTQVVTLAAGGATVATDGHDIGIAPVLAGSGGLLKADAGTLTLTGANTYAGATDVAAGTLLVNGNQSGATGLTSVANGATLGGIGTIGGNVAVGNGGILAPGTSPGTLTINGNLALAGGSVLAYEFGQADTVGGALNDLVIVGGNLTLDGTINVSVPAGGSFGHGTYRVFSYGGSLTDNGLALGSMPAGSNVSVQTSIANQVNLVNAPLVGLTFWDGAAGPKSNGVINGGDGTWHLGGIDNNWTELTGASNAFYLNGSFAVFAGAPGTVTIDNAPGTVTASGLQFASDGYRVTGETLTLLGPQTTIRVGDGTALGTGFTAAIAAELTGATQLVKTDLGTLVLTGSNSYTGGTAINGGTVRIASDANLGAASGGLSFHGGTLNTAANITSSRSVTLAGTGTFLTDAGTTLVLGGGVAGGGALAKDGLGTLVLAGDATQAGGSTIRSGTLQIGTGGTSGSLRGNVVNDGTLAFNRSDSISFDGRISGTGRLAQLGAGATTLTGLSSHSGATDVFAGTLVVDGAIANSAVLVHGGARLAGGGTVGATTVATGGTIAPGGSLGTLSVNGAYLQQAGAVYQVEVDPGSAASDRIAVSGTATLASGAVIAVTKTAAAPYRLGTRYTVLSTTNGLRGTFDLTGETDLTAFIRLAAAYDANNAYLVTQQSRTIASVGGTPNQVATGTGIDPAPPGNPVSTAVLNLPDEAAARGALDQLSGELHASVRTATLETSHFVRDAATDRVRTAFCGVAAEASRTGQRAEGTRRSPGDCGAADRLTVWGQAFGSWGSTSSDGNAAKMDRATGGFFVGADAPAFDTWRFGMLAGYSRSDIRVDGRISSATSDDYHLGVYGGTQWGRLGVRAGASHTWQDIGTSRAVGFAGFGQGLAADYRAGVTQAFGDLGYRLDAGGFALEPFASLAYVRLDSDGFSERGGAAALASPGNTGDTLFTTVGLRGSTVFTLGGIDILARGSIGWRHAFSDTTPIATLAFAGGPLFGIAGTPIARNAAIVNAGFEVDISETATLAVSYGGQFSNETIDQSLRGTFSLKF